MNRHLFRACVYGAVFVALLAGSAVAMAAGLPGEPAAAAALAQAGEGENDVVPVATWSIIGTLIGALVLGVLYLLKRRIGGFPKDPEWVAPISIERSETFPKEGDYGDVAHDSHGSHH